MKFLKTLLNPFGDDDEDFNVNYLIDRNLQVIFVGLLKLFLKDLVQFFFNLNFG